jgi:hypothetical protein
VIIITVLLFAIFLVLDDGMLTDDGDLGPDISIPADEEYVEPSGWLW